MPLLKSEAIDARTALLRACLDMSERDAAVTLAWVQSNGPERLETLLTGCLGRLAGEDTQIVQPPPGKVTRDDAITAIAAAVDLLVRAE